MPDASWWEKVRQQRDAQPYPTVIDEHSTLRLVLSGRSIARFGDGEFILAHGGSVPCERGGHDLRKRLREILQDSGDCLVGIPNICRSDNSKARLWEHFRRYSYLLTDRTYASSFITRPDSAWWIDTPEYWASVDTLWAGKRVVLARGGSERAINVFDLSSATSVREVVGPSRDAWRAHDTLLEQIGTPEVALLCLGPTATVLAVELSARGVHAIDAGHLGFFLRRHRLGLPMQQPERSPDYLALVRR